MLERWLSSTRRDLGPDRFSVDDVTELASPDEEMLATLSTVLLDARADPDYLRDMTEALGWERSTELIDHLLPGTKATSARRGEFGEILAAKILEEMHGFRIPVQKLRSAVVGGQVMPGTDVLALKLDGMTIVQVCYAEVKLRTERDVGLAVRALGQLESDVAQDLPDILGFVSRKLHELGDSLYEPFKIYMRDRQDLEGLDTYVVSVLFDVEVWDEAVIGNVVDSEPSLVPLDLHAIRLGQLGRLTGEVFERIGVSTLIEDDE
jgi:hypothetical protein